MNKFYSLSLASVEQLTEQSIAVTFEVPSTLKKVFTFKQGQHLTLKVMINNQEVRRSYSICNGIADQQLKIAIKQIEGGCFSTFANREFKAGMTIDVMPPQGHFYTELDPNSDKNYLLVAVGSGITPILSHIQSILNNEPKAQLSLIYGNKTVETTMFHQQLLDIEHENLQRFNRLNCYSREKNHLQVFHGRVTAQKIIDLDALGIIDINEFSDVFICGPESMVHDALTTFKSRQFSDEQLHYELFHVEEKVSEIDKKIQQAQQENQLTNCQVSIKVNGATIALALSTSGESILDAGLNENIDLPFACKAGVCGSCKAKVINGKVVMDANHALEDDEIIKGYILTCQSHPVSAQVDIVFD